MPYTTYNCDGLTGGTTRMLDALSVASLSDKDRALVLVGGQFIPFIFDASSTDAEDTANHPFKVRPDDFSTAGVWVEQVINADTLDGYNSTEFWLKQELGQCNYLINGGFPFWQHGESQTTSGYGSADRWYPAITGSTAMTFSQQAFPLEYSLVPGNFKYYGRGVVVTGSGAADYASLRYRCENVTTLSGKTATLSFYARADSSKNIAVEFVQYFGTGGSPSATVGAIGVTTVPLTSDFQLCTVTADIPSVSGKIVGTNNDDYLQIVLWFDAGSDYDSKTNSLGNQSGTFDVARVKLEEGSVATPFVRRPDGVELALCQRYYIRRVSGGFYPIGFGWAISSTSFRGFIPTPVPMRAPPSVNGIYEYNGAGSSISPVSPGAYLATDGAGILILDDVTGLTNDYTYAIIPNTTSGSPPYFELDAEL